MKPTMMLYTSGWHNKKTFKMLPTEKDCPYVEAIFDPENNVLAVFSTETKESLHMVPKLDDNGDPQSAKSRRGDKLYKEQRITLETYNEFYISLPNEIEEFIKKVSINAEEFDYSSFLYPVEEVKEPVKVPENVTAEVKE